LDGRLELDVKLQRVHEEVVVILHVHRVRKGKVLQKHHDLHVRKKKNKMNRKRQKTNTGKQTHKQHNKQLGRTFDLLFVIWTWAWLDLLNLSDVLTTGASSSLRDCSVRILLI
jgi:hypothetical protein